jgi:hypothetical protein
VLTASHSVRVVVDHYCSKVYISPRGMNQMIAPDSGRIPVTHQQNGVNFRPGKF